MRKEFTRLKGEPLHKWIDRISETYRFGEEIKELITSISTESYHEGSADALNTMNK